MNFYSDLVKQKALDLGFHLVGIATAEGLDANNQERLANWIALGFNASMRWMESPKRYLPKLVMPEVQSVICVALNYYTPHQHIQEDEYGKISRYAWGRDYHKIMHKSLKALTNWLENLEPGIKGRYYADTGPIQDKVWAQKAGIGWIAKNSNLITRKYGSWVFLGEVLTNLALAADKPHTQHCGSCTRCLQACPTNAITQPFIVDANRCIAYHTIENQDEHLPETITPHLHGWVAGCDICQDVCPWNQRFAQETNVVDFQPYTGNLAPKLKELASISDKDWDRQFTASALRRVKPKMLRRNARANIKTLSKTSEA